MLKNSEKIYSAESELRNPVLLVSDMFNAIVKSRGLAWVLCVRDIKTQYRQSYFGILWAIIPPVVTVIALLLARNANIINVGDTMIPYPAYVMISMSLWQVFTESVNGPVKAMAINRQLLTRVRLPIEAIILAKIGEVLFNLVIKLTLIACLLVFYDTGFSLHIMFSLPLIFLLVLLGMGFGLFFASLGTLYTDFSRLLVTILAFWLLLTPIFYPEPTQGTLSKLVRYNPVTPLVTNARDFLTNQSVLFSGYDLIMLIVPFVFLISGWVFIRLSLPYVVERMSS